MRAVIPSVERGIFDAHTLKNFISSIDMFTIFM